MEKYSSCKTKEIILNKKLGSGASGTIYSILASNKVAKVIHTNVLSSAMEFTIQMMVKEFKSGNVLNDITWNDSTKSKAFTWPEELLFCNGSFCGFIREDIGGDSEYLELTHITKDSFYEKDQWRFFLKKGNKLVLAQRISIVFSKFFESKKYQNGDIKPKNIMVNRKGFPTIIDMDNISIKTINGWIHPHKKMGSDNYKAIDWSEKPTDLYSDYFSLAVIIYELLFFNHPYDRTSNDELTRQQAINSNLYVYGPKKSEYIIIPKEHEKLKEFPLQIQNLFLRAFSGAPIERPNANEWANALTSYLTPSAIQKIDKFSRKCFYEIKKTVANWIKKLKVKKQKPTKISKQKGIKPKTFRPTILFNRYQKKADEFVDFFLDTDGIVVVSMISGIFNIGLLWLPFRLSGFSESLIILGYLYWFFLFFYGFFSSKFKFDWTIPVALGPLTIVFGFFGYFTTAYLIATWIYLVYGTLYLMYVNDFIFDSNQNFKRIRASSNLSNSFKKAKTQKYKSLVMWAIGFITITVLAYCILVKYKDTMTYILGNWNQSAKSSFSETFIMEENLLGVYKGIMNNKNLTIELNTINFNKKFVKGFNILGSNNRPLKGSFNVLKDNSEIVINFKLKEPGNHRWDGEFIIDVFAFLLHR